MVLDWMESGAVYMLWVWIQLGVSWQLEHRSGLYVFGIRERGIKALASSLAIRIACGVFLSARMGDMCVKWWTS